MPWSVAYSSSFAMAIATRMQGAGPCLSGAVPGSCLLEWAGCAAGRCPLAAATGLDRCILHTRGKASLGAIATCHRISMPQVPFRAAPSGTAGVTRRDPVPGRWEPHALVCSGACHACAEPVQSAGAQAGHLTQGPWLPPGALTSRLAAFSWCASWPSGRLQFGVYRCPDRGAGCSRALPVGCRSRGAEVADELPLGGRGNDGLSQRRDRLGRRPKPRCKSRV